MKDKKFLFVDGYSNTQADELEALFLANNVALLRSEQGIIGYDRDHLLIKSIDNGDWTNSFLDRVHKSEDNNGTTTPQEREQKSNLQSRYGTLLFTFKVPGDFDGFITKNGNKQIINQYEFGEQPSEPRFGVYKLTPEGIDIVKQLKESHIPLSASMVYNWECEPIKEKISISGAMLVTKIKPLGNSLLPVLPEENLPIMQPAIKSQANFLSVNSNNNIDFKKNIDANSNSVDIMEEKKEEQKSVNGTTLPYPIRPTVRLLLDKINILPEDKITAITKFVDNGCVCNTVSKNSCEEEKSVNEETEEQKETGVDVVAMIKELEEKREADKLELIDLIKGLKQAEEDKTVDNDAEKSKEEKSVNEDKTEKEKEEKEEQKSVNNNNKIIKGFWF